MLLHLHGYSSVFVGNKYMCASNMANGYKIHNKKLIENAVTSIS